MSRKSIEARCLVNHGLWARMPQDKDDKEYLYKGVEKENVSVSFIIGKDIKVEEAVMEKGLLSIKLKEENPLPKNVKEIPISKGQYQ